MRPDVIALIADNARTYRAKVNRPLVPVLIEGCGFATGSQVYWKVHGKARAVKPEAPASSLFEMDIHAGAIVNGEDDWVYVWSDSLPVREDECLEFAHGRWSVD